MKVLKKAELAELACLANDKPALIRAMKVALVVGIVLNLINNPQIYQSFTFSGIHPERLLLTFFVPFCVSLYSTVLTKFNK